MLDIVLDNAFQATGYGYNSDYLLGKAYRQTENGNGCSSQLQSLQIIKPADKW